MLSQVNYRVPNMRFLREKLPVTFYLSHTYPYFFFLRHLLSPSAVFLCFCQTDLLFKGLCWLLQDSELRNGDVSFSQFSQLYRSLMFDAQKNVSAVILSLQR